MTEAVKQEQNKLSKQQAQVKETLDKAQSKLKTLKNITSAAYLAAQELVDKNSVTFTWKNLSESATKSVLALEAALGRCAKCRWQSGCLACDPYKCFRHHLHKEAAQAKKQAFLSQGLGL